jgi:hypothetical protein
MSSSSYLLTLFAFACGANEPATHNATSATSTATQAQASGPLPATSVTFNQIADAGILYSSCAQGACHVPGYQPPDLSNSKGNLYELLTKTPISHCGNLMLVVPGVPAQSALLKIVKHQCANGWVMPPLVPENPTIDQSDVAALESWIAAGAPH